MAKQLFIAVLAQWPKPLTAQKGLRKLVEKNRIYRGFIFIELVKAVAFYIALQ